MTHRLEGDFVRISSDVNRKLAAAFLLHPKVVAYNPGNFVKDVQWIGAGSQPVTQERFDALLLENRTQYVTLATAQTRNETLQGEVARSAECLGSAQQVLQENSERHAADQVALRAQLEAERAARISQEQRARLAEACQALFSL